MDSKVIDSGHMLFNSGERHRLSYDMVFNNAPSSGERKRNNGSPPEEENANTVTEEELKALEREWQARLEQAQEEAYQKGKEEGMAEGEKRGRDEAMKTIEERFVPVFESVQAVDRHIESLMNDVKPYMATMVFELAEKVLELPVKSKELQAKVASEIRNILASLEREVKVNVEVAATDYGFMVRALKDIPHSDHVEIRSSEELKTGEYCIDTEKERVVKSFRKILNDFREKVALEVEEDLGGEEPC